MPLCLAADTSTPVNTVALCRDAQVLATTQVQCDRLHAERLINTVDWVLQEAGHELEEVELFAVATGPGSFTGLRIGASTWKGLAMATQKPLVAVPTLDAMARLAPATDRTVLTVLDAKMKEVYAAAYRWENGVRSKVLPDTVAPMEDILAQLDEAPYCLGDGVPLYEEAIRSTFPDAQIAPAHLHLPQAVGVAEEGQWLVTQGASTDAGLVSPVYLRKSQAEMLQDDRAGTGA